MVPPLRPLQQGRLDGLCGVYAIVNAVRLIVDGRSRMTLPASQDLFGTLIDILADDGKLQKAMTDGVPPKRLRKLAAAACEWVDSELGLSISTDRPFAGNRSLLFAEAAATMRSELAGEQGHAAYIIGTVEHWTVIRSVSACQIRLFDSAGMGHWTVARCRFRSEPARPYPTEHAIEKKAVLRVTRQMT
ncbi:hypothetical protein P2H44_07545 [Albimonas sp. CAU 1670]|uniref:hypothetical protein n=1 Tax=Albimonas sp. CAU 1670 TaxID=3032599 RepID=UPI0023DC2DF7|nr:hypothetical protein [Albimonas sp. CAU 1670]MDF2232406.1 hypothetical protein [Albimonas sp. CAU 1670]